MSRQDKLRARFWGSPLPKDFSWDELVTLLDGYGYKLKSKSGSHRKFINPHVPTRIYVPKPHPGSIVKTRYIREIRDNLMSEGFRDE